MERDCIWLSGGNMKSFYKRVSDLLEILIDKNRKGGQMLQGGAFNAS